MQNECSKRVQPKRLVLVFDLIKMASPSSIVSIGFYYAVGSWECNEVGVIFSAATASAAYGGQTGYAVAPAATAATYGTQRAAATGYDTAYQAAAATQGTYHNFLVYSEMLIKYAGDCVQA